MQNKLALTVFGSIISLMCLFFCLRGQVADAASTRSPEIRIFDSNSFNVEENFNAFAEKFQGGASVALCDLNGDGIDEIVAAAGPGSVPKIRTFTADGVPIFSNGFLAYAQNFNGGVNVACGDLDGDDKAEIITGPKSKGGLQVRIFDAYGNPTLAGSFFAYDSSIRGGINIAVGDLDGSGLNEIITAPTVGLNSLVKVFNRSGSPLPITFHPFSDTYTGGVSLAVGNVDGGADDELIMAVQSSGTARIKIYKADATQTILGQFNGFPETFKGGVNVSSGDIDNDGLDEIIVAANSGGGPQVRFFEANGKTVNRGFMAYETSFRGGVQVTSGDTNQDGIDEVITAPAKKYLSGTVDRIEVDISEQRLYAYEKGNLTKSFLVSTGVPGMDTHTGTFRISQKAYSKNYSGPGYYLPNTLWNLRFDGPRLLHGAYWHHDFGKKKSHGCVNMPYPEAEWIYNHTPIGTTVLVRQ